jgi:signal transduction histidine kinase
MKKYTKPLIIYLIFNLIFYIFIFISFSVLEYEQKNQIANATTRLIREKFLIKDFTGLTKDIEKIRSDNFTKIITMDKDNSPITQSVNADKLVNLKIKRSIWSDANNQHLKGKIVFYFSLDHLFLIVFKILIGSLVLTTPFGLLILKYLRKQQLEAVEIEKNKVLNKFTRQMSHDIRSPIASLHQLFDLNRILTEQEMKIFKTSLERIDYIANAYLDVSKKSYTAPTSNNLKEIIMEISDEKKTELRDLNINLQVNDIHAIFVKEELKRILSNLINNSYEATKSNPKIIDISAIESFKYNIIQIKDYGTGIPTSILNQIGTHEITTKNKGNGLGLLHAVETLKEWGVVFKVSQTDSNGTTVELMFPKSHKLIVLIDDDELVRLTWDSKAKRQNIELKTFSSYQSFLKDKNLIEKDSTIYIDSDLGENIKGEEVAVILHNEGFTDILMATGHSPDRFINLHFLKGVISKSPPF